MHQTLKIPWPISPREIVLERNFVYIPPNILQKGAENSESQVASDIDVDGGSDVLIPKLNTQEALPSEDVPEVGGIIIINYHSVLDDRIPMHPGRVRAESPLTMWRFQDVTHRERG